MSAGRMDLNWAAAVVARLAEEAKINKAPSTSNDRTAAEHRVATTIREGLRMADSIDSALARLRKKERSAEI